jgi:hypothetical protein
MSQVTSAPTVYRLSGDYATINFQTTSTIGGPALDYKTAETELKFSREQIRIIDTEFAKLVTVTVGPGDAGDTTLTLLIPTIGLTQEEPSPEFDTKAILMTLRKLGAVHQLYKVLNLHGTASAIPF